MANRTAVNDPIDSDLQEVSPYADMILYMY